jgi:CMP-N-acetylneuraminic acid synthetase
VRRICTILARGGSKGVPGKNIRLIGGKPLIAHSIAQALASGLFERVAVSSDDEAILRAAEEAGAHELIVRPAELASDTAPKLPAILHCVKDVEKREGRFDVVVDLQPTSPLREPSDIRGAVALLEESGAPNVITGATAKCSPYFSLVEERADGTVGLSKPTDPPLARRQDAPRTFDMNGSVYVWRREVLTADMKLFQPGTRLYEMPEERSVDIDTALDFEFAAFLMARRRA